MNLKNLKAEIKALRKEILEKELTPPEILMVFNRNDDPQLPSREIEAYRQRYGCSPKTVFVLDSADCRA